MEFPNKFLPYYDRRIYGLIDLYECQMACVRESVFNCRSASFDDKTKECFLGSCDRFCGYETVDRVYMTYSERVTCGYGKKLFLVLSLIRMTDKINTLSNINN